MPIVELEKGVWLAAWTGDPGRTLDIRSAKNFKTYKAAEFALMGARNYRPFANAVIRPKHRVHWICFQARQNRLVLHNPQTSNAHR